MRVRLDFPFLGALLIIAHLVGGTLTHNMGMNVGFKLVSGSFSVLVPVMMLLNLGSFVHCTTTSEMRAFAPEQDHEIYKERKQEIGHDFHTEPKLRRPRLLKELTMSNRQSCMAKILCGVDVAKPPSSSSSTVNDYAFIVKSFFDLFSLGGDNKKKSDTQNDGNDEDDPESDETKEEDDLEPDRPRRKNSKKQYFSSLRGQSDADLVDSYNDDLEALLNEPDGFLRKRSGQQRLLFHDSNCTNNGSVQKCKQGRNGRLLTRTPGFMGYANPRFDKTAFLNKKQLQIAQASNDQDKIKIAGEVADKIRSPRQCRLLSWLRPSSYTTTTTITTTSNEPSVAHTRNEVATTTMCPFTVSELQKMIVNTPVGNTTFGGQLVTPPGSTVSLVQLPSSWSTPAPFQNQVNPKYTVKPLKLTPYGETDPDLELMKDPFYALIPPEASPNQQQQTQGQILGFRQPIQYSSSKYQHINPAQLPFGHQRPSTMQNYFAEKTPTQATQDVSKYNKYFYLNLDGPSPPPSPIPVPSTTPTSQTIKLPPPTHKSTPKPANSDEDEDDEEEADDIDSGEDTNSDISETVHFQPSHPSMQQNSGDNSGQFQNSEKLIFGIPSKIHIPLPSIRGFTSKFRSQKARHSVLQPRPMLPQDPVDTNSDESPEQIRQDPRNRKRQAHQSHEKQLVFKTNLEYQERVKDQHSPALIMSRTPPAKLPPPPPLPPKSQQNSQNGDESDNSDEGEEDDEEDDEEDEERSSIPKQPSPQKQPTESTTLKKVPRPRPKVAESSKKNSTGVLRHFLSDHGMRTLSTITDMFYGSQQDEEVHPHDDVSGPPPGPPPRRKKGGPHGPPPKRQRRPPPNRRRRPGPRPQHDEPQADESEEDDEDEDSDEKEKATTKKPTTTQPPPLHPLLIPPRVVAVPIWLEGKEDWDGTEKPNEEEFFEPKPKKKAQDKPEKYDYDYADSVESKENGGQKIQTEYSDIADNLKRPGLKHPHNDRFVLGLPTTWEDMFIELERQKQIEKWKKKQSQENKNNKNNGSGSEEESEEDDNPSGRRPRPPSKNHPNFRPPAHHHYNLEPID